MNNMLTVQIPIQDNELEIERMDFCAACGIALSEHTVKTPLGFGTRDGQCLQAVNPIYGCKN